MWRIDRLVGIEGVCRCCYIRGRMDELSCIRQIVDGCSMSKLNVGNEQNGFFCHKISITFRQLRYYPSINQWEERPTWTSLGTNPEWENIKQPITPSFKSLLLLKKNCSQFQQQCVLFVLINDIVKKGCYVTYYNSLIKVLWQTRGRNQTPIGERRRFPQVATECISDLQGCND